MELYYRDLQAKRLDAAFPRRARRVLPVDCLGTTIYRLVEEQRAGSGRDDGSGWTLLPGTIDYDRKDEAQYALDRFPPQW